MLVLLFPTLMAAQNVAIKNNLLYDVTLTPNLGLEFALGPKATLDISGGYNPFKFSDHKQWKHWLVQPEYRYWVCEKFNGSFWGFHAHGGEFSFAKVKLPFGMLKQLRDYRYEGYFIGGGVSYGYHLILSKRWGLEATLGAGYTYINYSKFPCPECGDRLKSAGYNYLGITKAGISLIYIID